MNAHSHFLLLMISVLLPSLAKAFDPAEFPGFEAEQSFRPLLAMMPLEMEVGGARLFRQEDGTILLVSIGVTSSKPISGSELIRRRAVARAKAEALALAELNGTEVKVTTVMQSRNTVTIQDGKQSGISEELLEESIVTRVRGRLPGMEVVGTWTDPGGQLYFLAIGVRIQ